MTSVLARIKNPIPWIRNHYSVTITAILVGLLLFGIIKGGVTTDGRLSYQQEFDTSVGGPFESSGSNSRYALVSSIVDTGSLFFSDALAKFAAPDLVFHNGRYFSIFTPGVSFATVPLYALGKRVGAPQLFAYLTTLLVAVINMILVMHISEKLGASRPFAIVSGLLFLFGTNALVYALTLTQHHLSILVILTSIRLLFAAVSLKRNLLIGLLFGIGLLVDIPNAFIMIPIIIYTLWQHIRIADGEQHIRIKINLLSLFLCVGLIAPIAVFGWYNKTVTGSPMLLGQTIGRSDYPPAESPATRKEKQQPDPFGPKFPFYSRFQFNGLYILLFSNERGWLYYSPIVFLGAAGLFVALKKKETESQTLVILATVGMNIVLYSMFGDPWGGWAFGPRYLLPSAALLMVGIGQLIERFKHMVFFLIVFVTIAVYSVHISTLGAFTTSQVPPKQEAEHLVTFIPYTYEYNEQFIEKNKTSSLLYNVLLSKTVSGQTMLVGYQTIVTLLIAAWYIYGIVKTKTRRIP